MALHHFAAMALFAFFASVVFGTIGRDTLRGRVLYGIKAFVLFIVIAVVLGWIMYPFPH